MRISQLVENSLDKVYNFINTIDPDDAGVEDFGDYVVYYEGFHGECLYDVNRRIDDPDDPTECLDDVIDEVFDEFDYAAKQQGLSKVQQEIFGDSEYPIVVSIYKR